MGIYKIVDTEFSLEEGSHKKQFKTVRGAVVYIKKNFKVSLESLHYNLGGGDGAMSAAVPYDVDSSTYEEDGEKVPNSDYSQIDWELLNLPLAGVTACFVCLETGRPFYLQIVM